MGTPRFISRIREAAQKLAGRFRKPAMVGTPPSQRALWHDPAEHASDFAHRYAAPINIEVESRMVELGIDSLKIGWRDVGDDHKAFHPEGGAGGNISPDGRIIADSGIFNLDLLKERYGEATGRLFAKSRLKDRLDAIIAHEYEEHRNGFDHDAALKAAPMTELPVSARAREICRAMERGWKGR